MNDYEKTIEVLQNRVRALELLIQPVVGAAERACDMLNSGEVEL